MKFWNKQKEVRLRCWFKVTMPQEDHRGMYPKGIQTFHGWFQHGHFDDLKRELQASSSEGKFYMMILNKDIWFERSDDALIFRLSHE